MVSLFISLLTLILLLVSAFVVLLVLMQKASQSGGMGAALGGGAAESAFGAETSNILTKGTIYGIISFFVVALGLYLLYQSQLDAGGEIKDPAIFLNAAPEEGAEAVPAAEGNETGTTTPAANDANDANDETAASAGQPIDAPAAMSDAASGQGSDGPTPTEETAAEAPAPTAP